jgi:hypothetical protein
MEIVPQLDFPRKATMDLIGIGGGKPSLHGQGMAIDLIQAHPTYSRSSSQTTILLQKQPAEAMILRRLRRSRRTKISSSRILDWSSITFRSSFKTS